MQPDSPAVALTRATPDGPFTLITGALGVLASGWTEDLDVLLPMIHESLRPAREEVRVLDAAEVAAAVSAAASGEPLEEAGSAERMAFEALTALEAYYAGDVAAPGRVPTVQKSGPFREHAWDVLREVAPGEALTYTEFAARAGNPSAARAAASACATNAVALFVPCHRVMRTDGSLGGFQYGLAVKERLLAREAAAAPGVSAHSVSVSLF